MRYLIVGFGNIGKKRAAVLGKKLTVTVDPNPQADADFKDVKDVPLSSFDSAVLTIPQQSKYDLALYFLSRGKHLLIEKPLIINRSNFRILKNLAKKNNSVIQTSYNHRYEPNIEKFLSLTKEGLIGKTYFGKFIYSFGNIQERIGTWREKEYSVLEEIAPHLLDILLKNFDYKSKSFKTLFARKVESKIFDHWLIATTDQKFTLEISSVTWKNDFKLEVFGQFGSLHLNGLQKWGTSSLAIRKRVFPSGIPQEKTILKSGIDLTWKEDFKIFEKNVLANKSSLEHDLEISKSLANIVVTAPKSESPEFKTYKQILQ